MKNTKHNKKAHTGGAFMQDHGPATCVLVMPYSKYAGSDNSDIGVRRLDFTDIKTAKDASGKIHNEVKEGSGIRGYMVVKSKTEDYSVHEVILASPRRKLEFSEYVDGKFGGKVKVSLVRGPCLVSVPSARCKCASCGTFVRTVKDVMFANTVQKDIECEVNGKSVKKTLSVYYGDEKTVIKSLKDLRNMEVRCPRCGQKLDWIAAQRWRLSDREMVWSSTWEELIKDAIHQEQLSETKHRFAQALPLIIDVSKTEKGDQIPFDVEGEDPAVTAINRLQTKNPMMKVCLYDTALGFGRVDDILVAGPEFSAFSVDDVQDLRNLSFGDPKKPLRYWGRVGFVPRDIRKEQQRPGGMSIGEVFQLQGLDDFTAPDDHEDNED